MTRIIIEVLGGREIYASGDKLHSISPEKFFDVGGMWIAKVPPNIAFSALCAPGYIVWKFAVYGVMLVTRSTGGWKRTERRSLD